MLMSCGDTIGPDDFVRMPWQSFSTMKRFISEGNRLENASWRLWYMQKLNRGSQRRENASFDDDPYDEVQRETRKCVYCELAPAVLSCNGCCHDVYCVGCFKLIHMRGHLATHTAVKLIIPKSNSPRHSSTSPKPKAVQHSSINTPSKNAKVWEHKMDALFQKLMVTSLHHDGDISVHNLSVSVPSDEPFQQTTPETSSRGGKRSPVCNSCSGAHMTIMCPLLQPPVAATCENCKGPHSNHECPLKKSVKCTHCQGPHLFIHCPQLDAPPPSPPSSKGKKGKRFTCGNCRGDHLTIDCPQLPQASTPKHEKAAFVRKVYTNYHNDNTSNSTHSYLGDEVSVHGVHTRAFQPPPAQTFSTSYESIQEESSHHDHDQELHPILPSVAHNIAERRPDIWILSSLQELPPDLSMQQMSRAGSLCDENCWAHISDMRGWVLMRSFTSSSPQWHKRYVVLFRNTISEYVDDKATRPIGYANVSEGEVAFENGILTLSVTTTALRADGWTVTSWKFDTDEEGNKWRAAIENASQMKLSDFFGEDEGIELGQGRFSVVKRAQRKIPSQCAQECALKIIDKAAFWELVQQGVERNDTLFREVLTQSVLTMRCPTTHESFVVQLLSLFETHDYLVIEMELMHGGDVFDRIADRGSLPEDQAAIFISHLIQGIDFCLKNGIVHRDVKLSNLALDEGFQFGSFQQTSVLKLADFGMAAFLLPNGMLRGRCGTPGYVAPEILMAGVNEAYPPYVDMFSAGVVLYTLLCGYEPFFGRNDKELIALNKSVVYSFHPQEWAHISAEAKDLIQRMMQPDANDRITPQEALKHPFLKDIPVASFVARVACSRLF